MSTAVDVHGPDIQTPKATVLRPDIQAMRAVAVTGVVVYHLFPGVLPGGFVGVDVFFVISGFLITTHLVGAPPGGPRDFARFWGRRILRLLPPVLVVILTTLAGVLLFMSSSQWKQMAREAAASNLYLENWQLISNATNYLDAQRAESPFQHFWSLSVEEQYYIFWPFLVAALAWVAHRSTRTRTGHGRRRAVDARDRAATVFACGFGVVVLASFVWGVVQTQTAPQVSYFSTWTRMWELGLGSVLAVLFPRLVVLLSESWRAILLWAGLVGIGLSFALITSSTPFPGYAALLPTVATAAVILANDPVHRSNPRWLSRAAPVQLVGDTSYAWYLWHWPIIVLAPYALGRETAAWEKLVLVAVSLTLAWLSTHLLEGPIRASRFFRARLSRVYVLGASVTVLVLVASIAVTVHVDRQVAQASDDVQRALTADRPCFGAAAMAPGNDCPADQPLVTTPEYAKADITAGIRACLNFPPFPDTLISCSRGDTTDPVKRIALFGNSHAGQWLEALTRLAKLHHWEVDTFIVGACLSTIDPQAPECNGIAAQAGDAVLEGNYDAVIMSTYDRDPTGGPERYANTVQKFRDTGAHILVIHDTPAPWDPNNEIPDCIAANPTDFAACSGTPKKWIGKDDLYTAAQQLKDPGVTVVDLNDFICSRSTCFAVIGGVIVFSDFNHMSKTFSRTLAPYLEPAVVAALAATKGNDDAK